VSTLYYAIKYGIAFKALAYNYSTLPNSNTMKKYQNQNKKWEIHQNVGNYSILLNYYMYHVYGQLYTRQ